MTSMLLTARMCSAVSVAVTARWIAGMIYQFISGLRVIPAMRAGLRPARESWNPGSGAPPHLCPTWFTGSRFARARLVTPPTKVGRRARFAGTTAHSDFRYEDLSQASVRFGQGWFLLT